MSLLKKKELHPGSLYIVATPIGNLDDISYRAVSILKEVYIIAAEDTRHSKYLLHYHNIPTPMRSYHNFNEKTASESLLRILLEGKNVALISDAGTPLISDPGYHLVNNAYSLGISVIPIPGPSALITALSASGMTSDSFIFEGFIPSKATHRRVHFNALKNEARTLVFYESPHRIIQSLRDMQIIFGKGRIAVLARELTKKFEVIKRLPLAELSQFVINDINQRKGEFTIILQGSSVDETEVCPDSDTLRILKLLIDEIPLKKAVDLTSKITDKRKNKLYPLAIKIQERVKFDTISTSSVVGD